MGKKIHCLNMLTVCYALFSFALYTPEKPMNVYNWMRLLLMQILIYLILYTFVLSHKKQKPLAYLFLILYIILLISRQIFSMYKYIKMFHGQESGLSLIIITVLMLTIYTTTNTDLYKLAGVCTVMMGLMLLAVTAMNTVKISATDLYQAERSLSFIPGITLFDYMVPYAVVYNSLGVKKRNKALNVLLIAVTIILILILLAFSCTNGNLLYRLSPLQMLFQLSSTDYIRNTDALFNFFLMFGYFAAVAVLILSYKEIKKNFKYFNNSILILIIPFFVMNHYIDNTMFFLFEIVAASIVFICRRRSFS